MPPSVRLTFLYPHLFRSIRISEPVAKSTALRVKTRTHQGQCRSLNARGFATAEAREQRFVKRHGKAVEPIVHDDGPTEKGSESISEETEGLKVFEPKEERKEIDSSKELKKKQQDAAAKDAEEKKAEAEPSSSDPLSEETQAAARLPGDDGLLPFDQPIPSREETSTPSVATVSSEPLGPIDTILQMPPPESPEEENANKPPHLQTPPYVHHFDTYTLVQQVEAGGFTMDQSITAMKAVRGLLAENLEIARRGLVSKSDVENETYLFRAACSELRTEIENSRKKSEETMRRERTLLQHEVDILNQKLTQEVLTLKDDLKGMFDDRKMSVREEQRLMESKIQTLNYQITVMLNSDAKSEIEGLRWVLTRRSVMGILFMAFMVLTSLRYASYKSHEDEMRKKREAGMKADETTEDLPPQGAAEILAAN